MLHTTKLALQNCLSKICEKWTAKILQAAKQPAAGPVPTTAAHARHAGLYNHMQVVQQPRLLVQGQLMSGTGIE
jgi:hypothetical protein